MQGTLIAFDMTGKSDDEKKKVASKLHRQFGHPTHEKLAELVKLFGVKRGGIP